jgi:hypothetical protein
MAVTAWWYVNAFETAFNKEIDFITDDIAVSLHTVTYVPNQDTHDFFDDLTNQLATANGYTNENGTGTGELMASKTHANTLNVSAFDAANTVWTSSGAGFTARIAAYSDVTTNVTTTDPLLWWIDFGQDETASGGGTFTIAYDASGIATITPADATGFPA